MSVLEVEIAEQDLHVGERVDGDAAAADLALGMGVVGIAAHQRRHVERDGQSRLPVLDQELEALVRLLGRTEAGELPHRPQAPPIPARVDATRERVLARKADLRVDVGGPIERIDGDAGERVEVDVVPELRFAVPLAPAIVGVCHALSLPRGSLFQGLDQAVGGRVGVE